MYIRKLKSFGRKNFSVNRRDWSIAVRSFFISPKIVTLLASLNTWNGTVHRNPRCLSIAYFNFIMCRISSCLLLQIFTGMPCATPLLFQGIRKCVTCNSFEVLPVAVAQWSSSCLVIGSSWVRAPCLGRCYIVRFSPGRLAI